MTQDSLPSGWTWATPVELASPDRNALAIGPFGSSLKVSDYRSSGVPLVFVRNIRSGQFGTPGTQFVSQEKARELAAHRVEAGDILITKMGDPPGDACIYPEGQPPAIITADCIKFRLASDKGVRKYFAYAFASPLVRAQVSARTKGVAQQKISLETFRTLRLPVAPVFEQRQVVAEVEKQLTRLDAGVQALRRLQAHLRRYRAAVLKAACEGSLVPTEASLGKPYETGQQLILRAVSARARIQHESGVRGRTKPSELLCTAPFALPEGWACAQLCDIAALQGGITKGQKRRPEDRLRPVLYLRVANVQRGFLNLSEMKHIEATEDEIAVLRLKRGDILFNEGGDRDKLGRGWIWNEEVSECIHQNHVFRARLFINDIEPKFVSWYGNSFGQYYFLEQGKQTTNLASINMTKLSALPVPIPPAAEQRRIVADVEARLTYVVAIESIVASNLLRAARLRSSILRAAFEGRLAGSEEPAPAHIA